MADTVVVCAMNSEAEEGGREGGREGGVNSATVEHTNCL